MERERHRAGARRAVVTGGPGSGKTTLVRALGALGYATVPEAAIQIISELNAELGLETQKRWRREHPVEFQRRVFERQIELESAVEGSAGEWIFQDRGILDGIAYLRHFGRELPPDLVELAKRRRYDAVFFLETPRRFDDRPGTGRTSTRADSIAIGRRILEVYSEQGYEPVRLPEAPLEERVAQVLERLPAVRRRV